MRHTFISYCHEDVDFAQILAGHVREAGFPIWADVELNAGDEWGTAIDDRIREALALVVVMSPDSVASSYVNFEWAFALGCGIPVLPVLLRVSPDSIHPRLAGIQCLDFGDHLNRPWSRLIDAIQEAADAQRVFTLRLPRDAPPVIQEAARSLDSMNATERSAAVASLSQMDHPAALDLLAQAAAHPIRDVRFATAIALSERLDIRAIPGILEAVRCGEEAVKPFLLVRLGQPAVPALLECLVDRNLVLRDFAFETLGYIGGPVAVAELIRHLGDPDPDLRRIATWALYSAADPAAVPPLRAALAEPASRLRTAVASALAKCGGSAVIPDLLPLLGDPDQEVRHTTVCRLEEFAAAGVGPAQADMLIAGLLQALDDSYDQVSLFAGRALATLRDPRAIPGLIEALRKPNSSVSGITTALRPLGAAAVPAFREALADAVPIVRLTAVQFIGEFGDGTDTPRLIAMLRDEHSGVRMNAAMVLGRRKDPATPGEELIPLLHDDNEDVCKAAARALGSLRNPGAVPALIDALEDEGVAEAAADALENFDTRTARAAYRKWQREHKEQ